MSEPREMTARDVRDRFLDLAERYEVAAALDLTTASLERLMRTAPGSRVPPGVQEILDEDEATTTMEAVDDWALFLAHVLADERDVAAPSPTTPGRLRLAAEHSDHFVVDDGLPDTDGHGLMALAVQDDLHDHLRSVRRLTGRTVRQVRTGMACQTGCGGQYVSPLGVSGDRHDSSLRCDNARCGHLVPYATWSRWPHSRVHFITVEHAAHMAGTTVATIWKRASRGKWRRIGTGSDVRYSVEDVRGSMGVDDVRGTEKVEA